MTIKLTGKANREIEYLPYQKCCAKSDQNERPGISVEQHCRIVGHVARELIPRLPNTVQALLPQCAPTIAALHDVGKVSPGFQLKYFSARVRSIAPSLADIPLHRFQTDHASVGAAALNCYLSSPNRMVAAAQAIALHHGAIRNVALQDNGGIFGGKTWAEERKKLINVVIGEFGDELLKNMSDASRDLLSGLVTIADWIGSDEEFFPPSGLPPDSDPASRAREAVTACGFGIPRIVGSLSFEDIFNGKKMYPLQKEFAQQAKKPGLYILEAPMGQGKTEAALFVAYKLMEKGMNCGLYFGLPTRLTSDKIHERVQAFLDIVCADKTPAKLAHGAAWLKAFEHGNVNRHEESGSAWFNPRKRKLLYPFAVGTIDQALLSVLRVKHFFVRLYGLAGKVVILDEVHTYDMYTGTLLHVLVRRLLDLQCTVIILSATLSGSRRDRLISAQTPDTSDAYPLITLKLEGKPTAVPATAPSAQTYHVYVADHNVAQVATKAVEKAAAGFCVLCIANTVARAQEWFDAVKSTMAEDSFEVGLLHSKFPLFQREAKENRWLDLLGPNGKRPPGCILVATQVVEQSVDIDADFLVTELAPTDMLLQRMGRQWRHAERNRPSGYPETVIVAADVPKEGSAEEVVEALGKTNCFVYSPYVLWKTLQVWKGQSEVVIPRDVRKLIEATYASEEEEEPESVRQLREQTTAMAEKLRAHAMAARAEVTSMPTNNDREGVATRYSDLATTQILLVRAIEDSTGRRARLRLLNENDETSVEVDAHKVDFFITAKLHRHLMSIATHWLRPIANPSTPDYLRKHFYEPTPVLVWDKETGDISWDGQRTGLSYTVERGLGWRLRVEKREARPLARDLCGEYDNFDVFDKQRLDW